jgi:hypothetical protein
VFGFRFGSLAYRWNLVPEKWEPIGSKFFFKEPSISVLSYFSLVPVLTELTKFFQKISRQQKNIRILR